MKKIIRKYLKSLSFSELPYSKYKEIHASAMAENPQLWIPHWNVVKERELEIILFNYGRLIFGKGKQHTLLSEENRGLLNTDDHPFRLLELFEQEWQQTSPNPLAFYFGLLSYDIFRQAQKTEMNTDFYNLPDYYIILPGKGYLIDHINQKIWNINSTLPHLKFQASDYSSEMNSNKLTFNETKQQYIQKIKKIRSLISEGEVYQINYTSRFSSKLSVTGLDFFRSVYKLNPAPFSIYARLPELELISNSPERFLMTKGKQVTTEPIKGTIQTNANPEINEQLKMKLSASEKDGAELSMIVDLMRNDLSTVCEAGSVQVTSHKRLETFQNVHHLVSTISGQLTADRTFVDLLKSAFPGGSITGCPKIASMHYINQLENHNRSFYTGSFFMRFPGQDIFDSNILIRTAIKKGRNIHFQAGGGIVIDSSPESEYNECLAKADTFFKTLEQMNVHNDKQ